MGEAPVDGQQESEKIALRRTELAQQLKNVRAPLIVEKEAYLRASGLIGEIDKIVRSRRKGALLNLNSTPLNPIHWPIAVADLNNRISKIMSEMRTRWSNELAKQLRKQNGPVILLLVVFGLLLMIPARRWIARSLATAGSRSSNKFGNVTRLLLSLGIFIIPMLGLMLLLVAVDLADIFSVQGDLLMRSVPMMGLSVFGANWLVRNLPQSKIFSGDQTGEMAKLLLGGRRTILTLGAIMAISYILVGLSKGEEWSGDTKSVLRFPLVILLGTGLFHGGRLISKFRDLLNLEDRAKSIPESMTTLFMWACYISGVIGPVLSGLGYSNAGTTLVFAMVHTLALSGGLLVFYSLLVHFISALGVASDQITDERSAGGLYKVALAFVLMCASVPVFALIWGASVNDIGDLWYSMNKGVSLGDAQVSISDFFVFILIFFIGYTITKLLQSALRTLVFPNTRIESGAQNALVTGFGYIGIFLAAIIAVTTTGLDLSSLAIVAGALSVGIGFGLQAVVSNFVSGIILLVERPVKIGDWIEIGTDMGTVRKISVRSTSIETFDGATVIVPNADLIAGTVTNWTHGNIRGRVKVPVGVAYGTDPELVKEVLLSIADDHPMLLKLPKPAVVFMGFGADAMDFQLRGILRDVNYVLSTASDINFEIVKRFAENNIVIPFAQREVTIKNAKDFLPQVARPAGKTSGKAARKPRAKPKS